MIDAKRTKIDNSSWYNYFFKNGESELGIIFGGNGDLYFNSGFIHDEEESTFVVDKQNMVLYSLLEDMFADYEECEIFKVYETSLETPEELQEKAERVSRMNKRLKESSLYKRVYSNNTITWVSDDSVSTELEDSNTVKITKEEERFVFHFTYKEKDLIRSNSIRFRNSGSRFEPFNLIMMKFFNNLQEYVPEYHQVHLEEFAHENGIQLVKKTQKRP